MVLLKTGGKMGSGLVHQIGPRFQESQTAPVKAPVVDKHPEWSFRNIKL